MFCFIKAEKLTIPIRVKVCLSLPIMANSEPKLNNLHPNPLREGYFQVDSLGKLLLNFPGIPHDKKSPLNKPFPRLTTTATQPFTFNFLLKPGS